MGWYDQDEGLLFMDEAWLDTYGASRILTARFE